MLINPRTNKIKKRVSPMRKILGFIAIALISFSALADHHGSIKAEVTEVAEAFNTAYATNDLETYYGFYTEDAVLYFSGDRPMVSDYREDWTASFEAGARVEKYEASDVHIRLLASGDAAVVTSFVEDRTRAENGQLSTERAFETDIWEKIDGEWKVVGVHYSSIVPDD
jgi:uncharacterized protein (TIGR02246 family)